MYEAGPAKAKKLEKCVKKDHYLKKFYKEWVNKLMNVMNQMRF